MKKQSFLVLLTAFSILFVAACNKSSNPAASGKNNLVFIYYNDNSEGVAFKSLLEGNGCAVTLVDRSSVAAFDFSGFSMIIIGNNTDTLNTGNDWSPADAMKIKNTGKPILLMGEGGMLFANNIQDTVNWETSATNSLTGFKAVDPANTVYKQPKSISVGSDSLMTLYSSASRVVSFYAASIPVPNVLMIGGETGVVGQHYYSISVANGKFGAFGYCANLNAMTPAGQDFFVNLVYYVGSLTLR